MKYQYIILVATVIIIASLVLVFAGPPLLNLNPATEIPPTPTPTSGTPATQVSLTMGVSGSGDVTPSIGTHYYDIGSTIQILATPTSGWEFDYWLFDDGQSNTNPSTSMTMSRSRTALAVFTQIITPTPTPIGQTPDPNPTPTPTPAPTPIPLVTSPSPTLRTYIDLVKKFSPKIYFNSQEDFYPCSIEHLLHNGKLLQNNNEDFRIDNPNQQALAEYYENDYYVSVNETQFYGMKADNKISAPMYYAVQEYEDRIEITYLLLYAYNGGQGCEIDAHLVPPLFEYFNIIVYPFGVHQGDIEEFKIILNPDSEGEYNINRVGFSAHGSFRWYYYHQCLLEDDHVVALAALNSHALYNPKEFPGHVWLEGGAGPVTFYDYIDKYGVIWESWKTDDFRLLRLDSNGEPLGTELWAKFKGRLGRTIYHTQITGATDLYGNNLNSTQWSFVWAIDQFAKDEYSEEIKTEKGCWGPGDRDFLKPLAPWYSYTVRVTVDELKCVYANDFDDTPAWYVDLDRFWVKVTTYDTNYNSEGSFPIDVFNWGTSGVCRIKPPESFYPATTPNNTAWLPAGSFFPSGSDLNYVDIVFDEKRHDFPTDNVWLVFEARVRDFDTSNIDDPFGDNDAAGAKFRINGSQFLENGGEHVFYIGFWKQHGSEQWWQYNFAVHIRIELIG